MSKIIAISNQKGGVGKTATAINLSAALASLKRRVLLIDMDVQGNSSRGFGIDITLVNNSIFDVLIGKININKAIKRTMIKDLDIIPSKPIITSLESYINKNEQNSYLIFKKCLGDLESEYDYIIVDCPPSLGFLTLNVLVAASTVLIPVQCEYFATEAITQILSSVSRIQSQYNPELGIEGFLLTMYDPKSSFADEFCNQVRGLFKENTFLTRIPRNVSIPESNAKGVPVTLFRPTSSGALAYISLAKEVIDHEER